MSEGFTVRIQALLDEVGSVSQRGAAYHGLHDQTLLRNRSLQTFCRLSLQNPATSSLCRYACCNATVNSFSSGEPAYTQCWAGLLTSTVALAPRGVVLGGITAGGFYSLDAEPDIQRTVRDRLRTLPRRDVHELLRPLRDLHPITPGELRGLGQYMLEASFSSGLNSADRFARQNARYRQQREIAETAEDLRHLEPASMTRPPDLYELASGIHHDDPESARRLVSRHLARLLTAGNWDLKKVKAHLRVVLAVITSQDILRGMPWEAAVNRELLYMNRLERADSLEACCYEVAERVQQPFPSGSALSEGHGPLAERLAVWLQRHYGEKVTLDSASRSVGASTSTLAHTCRRTTGKTFHDLLLETRLAEARRLLATTTLKISDIAERCGFTDQSHFTRLLKQATSLTPGQFRRLLIVTADEVQIAG